MSLTILGCLYLNQPQDSPPILLLVTHVSVARVSFCNSGPAEAVPVLSIWKRVPLRSDLQFFKEVLKVWLRLVIPLCMWWTPITLGLQCHQGSARGDSVLGDTQILLFMFLSVALCGIVIEAFLIHHFHHLESVSTKSTPAFHTCHSFFL